MSCSIEKTFSQCSLEDNNTDNRNVIFWDESSGSGYVKFPKGNIWNCMGVIRYDKVYIHSDEACFLIDSYNYSISTETETETDTIVCDDNFILRILSQDCGLNSFKIYNHLRKLGYILLRPEFPFYQKARLFDSLRSEYSLFKPNSKFKKTAPSNDNGFLGHLLEIKNNDNLREIIRRIEETMMVPSSTSCFLCISDGSSSELCYLESQIIKPTPSTTTTNAAATGSPTSSLNNNNQLTRSKSPKSTGV